MGLDTYFGLFSRRGDVLQSELASAIFRAALAISGRIVPVASGGTTSIRWIAGPCQTMRVSESMLPGAVQDALAADGVDLAADLFFLCQLRFTMYRMH